MPALRLLCCCYAAIICYALFSCLRRHYFRLLRHAATLTLRHDITLIFLRCSLPLFAADAAATLFHAAIFAAVAFLPLTARDMRAVGHHVDEPLRRYFLLPCQLPPVTTPTSV